MARYQIYYTFCTRRCEGAGLDRRKRPEPMYEEGPVPLSAVYEARGTPPSNVVSRLLEDLARQLITESTSFSPGT